MKLDLVGFAGVLELVGVVYFIFRSFLSTVQQNEPFARDLFGFPLLEPGLEVTDQIWMMSLIGSLLPFVLILVGYGVKKLASKNIRHYEK